MTKNDLCHIYGWNKVTDRSISGFAAVYPQKAIEWAETCEGGQKEDSNGDK